MAKSFLYIKYISGFLGLICCYGKFINDYGKIVEHMTEISKKYNFRRNDKEHRAFEELKKVIAQFQC